MESFASAEESREIACLEIESLISIALGVASTRYPITLIRRENPPENPEESQPKVYTVITYRTFTAFPDVT